MRRCCDTGVLSFLMYNRRRETIFYFILNQDILSVNHMSHTHHRESSLLYSTLYHSPGSSIDSGRKKTCSISSSSFLSANGLPAPIPYSHSRSAFPTSLSQQLHSPLHISQSLPQPGPRAPNDGRNDPVQTDKVNNQHTACLPSLDHLDAPPPGPFSHVESKTHNIQSLLTRLNSRSSHAAMERVLLYSDALFSYLRLTCEYTRDNLTTSMASFHMTLFL